MYLWLLSITFPLLIALVCPAAYAQSEEQCLGIGKFAELAANLLHLGQPEERVLADMLDPTASGSKRPKAQQKMLDERDTAVVNWVYTVRPSAQDARAIVYAKCMSGGLGSFDMAKYKAAGKSKQR
jgi:hypothetical protein